MSYLLNYDFIQRAYLAVIAISLFAPIIGVFLVLRRQSLLSDTLSHISLAGIAFGILLGWSTTITTLIVVIIAAIALEYLRKLYKNFAEVSTAILMSVGLSIALIVQSKSSSNISIDQFLFGSIVTITNAQVIELFITAAVALILFFVFYKQMYLMTFDEDTAQVEGVATRWISISFNVVTAVTIALMIPVAGALLVSAIIVLPASIAIRISHNFRSTFINAIIISLLGMTIGLLISFIADIPASASITMTLTAIFTISLIK